MKYIIGIAIAISIFLLPLQNQQAVEAKEPSLIAEGLTAYAKNFEQVGEFYGKYLNYHLIEVKEITETSRMVIISMNYELGPVYAKFLTYKAKAGWILVNFDFNTKPEIILPALFIK